MEILGIIPARGGSKGIPHKNLVDLGGWPLLTWTLRAAKLAPCLTRLLVSTEDAAIATLAADWEVPVMPRPPALATDTVTATQVVVHVLQTLYLEDTYVPDVVLMLLPTSPFRTPEHIDAAVSLWARSRCDAVCGVQRLCAHTLETIRTQDAEGYLHRHCADGPLPQRQQQTPLYRVNGALFLAAERALLAHQSFHVPYTLGYAMDAASSLEIDTPADLEHARRLAEHRYV